MKVTFFFRKRLQGFNSIEGLFYNISDAVKDHIQTVNVELPSSDFSLKGVSQNLKFTNKYKGEINHITGHVNYLAIATRKRTVLTIHDVKSSLYGNFFHQTLIKMLMFWLPALYVKRITVISEFTKKELQAIIPFSKSKINVIYNPVNPLFQPKGFIFNSQCPTILCIGTKANKNLERVFESLRGITCKLNLIGRLSDEQLRLLQEYHINYINSVNLTQKEIVESYENCDLLCFPSTYEGFGLPIIEAQAVGRPVITSNVGAMLEVAQDSACLVDPYDINTIKKGIEKIIFEEDYRQILIQKGFENVKRFQLDTIVKQYINIYKEISS